MKKRILAILALIAYVAFIVWFTVKDLPKILTGGTDKNISVSSEETEK